jgi:hypothetical protein
MVRITNKTRLTTALFCLFFTTFLLAQRPNFTTRLISPVDTSISNFTMAASGFPLVIMDDSSVMATGNAGNNLCS